MGIKKIGECELYLGDCKDILSKITADFTVTSPPYNLGGFHAFKKGKDTKHKYDEFQDEMPESDYQEDQIKVCNLIYDVTGGPLFYSHKNRIVESEMISPLDWLKGSKWVVHQSVVINKGSGANVDKRRFFPVHEHMYVCLKTKDQRLDNSDCLTDVWQVQQTNRKDALHPATMPLSVAEKCVRSFGGEVVLDPYMGSGTTAIAAINQGRKFIGIERSEKYFQLSCKRIEEYYKERLI